MPADLATRPAPTLSATEDDELTQLELSVDISLDVAVESLVELRRRDAHRKRGFTLWHEYVVDRFGAALARLRLPDGERLALVQSMCTKTDDHPDGLPVRRQAALIGVSNGTVQNDKRALGLAPPKPTPLPAATGYVYEQAAEWVRRAAAGLMPGKPDGLTLIELAKAAGWSEGAASGALSDARRRGLIVRTEVRRASQRVHVPPPA